MSEGKWTSDELFTRLLNNKSQEAYWDDVSELRKRPNNDVFTKSFELAKSNDDLQKIIGLDILQQLGFEPRFNKKETLDLHFELLEVAQSNRVLVSIFHGIGHNNDELEDWQISKLVEFKNQTNTEVKHALISALSGIENLQAISALIEFTKQKEPSIRNWATFGIGTQIDTDNAEIRNALWNLVGDSDYDTKSEAIVGLAKRNDEKIKKVILAELQSDSFGTLLFDAILALGDDDYLPILNDKLQQVKNEDNEINRGWIPALEGTIEELEKRTHNSA